MEEIIAVGRVWHNSCFVCSGTKGDGCKRTLTRDNYLDHENQPYCQACYSKLFKPKGFGYGNTLNTDYGPGPETVESEGQTHQTFEKPKAPGRPAHAAANSFTASPVAAPAPTLPRSASSETPAPKPVPPPPPVPPAAPLVIPVTDPSDIKKGTVKIGKGGELYQEASYQGDNDEVDESEW
jgi:hypothetical protein